MTSIRRALGSRTLALAIFLAVYAGLFAVVLAPKGSLVTPGGPDRATLREAASVAMREPPTLVPSSGPDIVLGAAE